MLKMILQGMAVGIANIIPGVSGGTMMVAMGLYDKLIHAITHLKKEFKKSMGILIPIFLGVGIALVALSFVFTYLLENYPIPTNFAFCGLIVGSLPFILNNVKGEKISVGKVLSFVVFFAVVILMALLGKANEAAQGANEAEASVLTIHSAMDVVKLLVVGIIAAATMVIPGVSGSMMLILMGCYHEILATIKAVILALTEFNLAKMFTYALPLIPAGIGIVIGIFGIAKLIEFLFQKARAHVYYAIIGLITASPIAILLNVSWDGFSVPILLIGCVTFVVGWFAASKLGGE